MRKVLIAEFLAAGTTLVLSPQAFSQGTGGTTGTNPALSTPPLPQPGPGFAAGGGGAPSNIVSLPRRTSRRTRTARSMPWISWTKSSIASSPFAAVAKTTPDRPVELVGTADRDWGKLGSVMESAARVQPIVRASIHRYSARRASAR
jgi:hypothetical protein